MGQRILSRQLYFMGIHNEQFYSGRKFIRHRKYGCIDPDGSRSLAQYHLLFQSGKSIFRNHKMDGKSIIFIHLNLSQSGNRSSDLWRIFIQRNLKLGCSSSNAFKFTSSTTDYSVSTLTVVGLNSDTTYWFRIGAYNWNNVTNYAVVGSTMFPSGAGTGTAGFASSDSPQEIENASVDERLTITGDGEFTITGVSVTIPSGWDWSGSASDISLSGTGFDPAPDVSVNGNVVTIGTTTSASITAVDVGTITFTNLTPPSTAGNAAANKFTVETKGAGGFSEISSSPGIIVYGKTSLGTDGSYNPPEGDGITPSSECLIAAFTLTAQGEGITISSFSVHFTAVGGATFGTDFTSFKIYRESNATPDGWYSGSGDEVLDESAKTMTAASDYVYEPDQNHSLGAGGTTTYYLTVQTNDEAELKVQEGISVEIKVGSVTVTGNVSSVSFNNIGSFTGNEIIRGGVAEPTYELTLRLGLDRHSFYDGSLYWAFFINSSRNVVYSTSTNGVNWGGEIKINDSAAGLSSMGIYEDGTYIWVTYTKGQPFTDN